MLHLLKESTKPVPRQKKRRTIEALAKPDPIDNMSAMQSRPQFSAAPDKTNGNEERKDCSKPKGSTANSCLRVGGMSRKAFKNTIGLF